MSSDFDRLDPQLILNSLDLAGYPATGEYSQLNSYENRVFDLYLESKTLPRVIAKFYRPGRWSAQAITDEHQFLFDLQSEGIPVVAPLPLKNSSTILHHHGYIMALFPRAYGRMPDEFLPGQLKQIGRTLARIHNVGARSHAGNRLTLSASSYGWPAVERLERYVYPELWPQYEDVAIAILNYLEDELDESTYVRIHGDCHKGNLLHTGSEFFFVDFDDFCNGPVVQDFWLLFSSSEEDAVSEAERDEIFSGYEDLRDIPDELHLLEPLRALRIIHYGGWIASRWNDPFFKRVFPAFTTYNYWLDEINRLEKIANSL